MVNFTDLPEEMIIIILRKLDLCSVHNLYNACRQTRRIVQLPGVIKIFNMSLNPMATAHSLKLKLFKDIANHLQVLNMCGVPDLKKTSLLLAIKSLKRLKTLDVTYTNINIIDFIELYPLCPTIKNISINFVFGKLGLTVISGKMLIQCQNVFENLENVHFVGSLANLQYSFLPFSVLHKANLNTLKYSVAECDYVCTTSLSQNHFIEPHWKPSFSYFHICLLNWRECNVYYQHISSLPAFSKLNLEAYEFIIIIMLSIDKFTVLISPIFVDFFNRNFDIDVECTMSFNKPLLGNVSIMIWKKENNKFDTAFYNNLFNEIKEYFPKYCVSETCVPPKYDSFYIIPNDENVEVDVQNYEPELRKRRLAAPNLVLNYDSVFKNKHMIQLSLLFHDDVKGTITLKADCDYLKKITFLSLSGPVRYGSEFFNILFRSCHNLITLNVEASSVYPCASSISRALPSSQCLKNLRLTDRRINYNLLFLSLSQCLTLENIYVTENSELRLSEFSDPSIIIEKCEKLYNIYIEAPMSESARMKNLQRMNKAKDICKRYALTVTLLAKSYNNKFRYCYDPFIGMFKLYPIKPIL